MLNENYYNKLINKHSISQCCNKVVYITTSAILNNYRGKNVYFNFPKRYDLKEITTDRQNFTSFDQLKKNSV